MPRVAIPLTTYSVCPRIGDRPTAIYQFRHQPRQEVAQGEVVLNVDELTDPTKVLAAIRVAYLQGHADRLELLKLAHSMDAVEPYRVYDVKGED